MNARLQLVQHGGEEHDVRLRRGGRVAEDVRSDEAYGRRATTRDAADREANEPVVTSLMQRRIDQRLLRASPVTVVARMLGAAFGEAGAIIAAAGDPRALRREVEGILLAWIRTLRA